MSDEETVEQRATDIGWREGGSKSAEEFLDARNHHLGAANADIKKLESQLSSMRGEVSKTNETMDAMVKFFEKNQTEQTTARYDSAINTQKGKLREAAEAGEPESFDKVAKNIDALEQQKQEKLKNQEKIVPHDEVSTAQREILAHRDENPHLFDTAAKQKAWVNEVQHQGNLHPDKSLADIMGMADKIMTPQENMPGPDAGGGDPPPQGEDVVFNQIPKADKEVYKKFAAEMPGYTKEKFMEQYNG